LIADYLTKQSPRHYLYYKGGICDTESQVKCSRSSEPVTELWRALFLHLHHWEMVSIIYRSLYVA